MKTNILISSTATLLLAATSVFAQTGGNGTTTTGGSATLPGSDSKSGTAVVPGSTTNPGMGSNNNSSDWTTQNTYWRDNYSSRPYYSPSRNYSTYEPAYRYGVDLYNRNSGKRWEDLDSSQLGTSWNNSRGNSNLDWKDAQQASRDAYNRMYENRNTGSSATPPSGSTVR